MKTSGIRIKPSLLIFIAVMGYVGYFVSCTQKDQFIRPAAATVDSTVNTTNLLSIKTSIVPILDGVIDAAWTSAPKLSVTPTVPDPGNGLFTGYSGTQYPLILRSMYDATNIYFLAEITDATQTIIPAPWYFDPAKNTAGKTGWTKEPNQKTFDANGNLLRAPYGEDRLAMLWNIDNSTPKFITQTCYASCHVFTSYMDFSGTTPVEKSNANSGNHYTNGAAEKIDMWWGRLGYASKDASLHFMDDNYQDWAGGPDVTNLTGGNANGRHVDGQIPDGTKSSTWPNRPNYTTSPSQGEFSNSQNLKLDGTGNSVAVPIWVLVSGAKTGFILPADTASGAALKVIAVSSAGALTLSDNVTIIDPTVGTDYQKTGDAVTGPTAAKGIPTYIGFPLLNGRADIACAAFYSGTGWIVEYKRALKTSDLLKQDVDFSTLADTPFGVAVWDNSNYQHGIQPNLLLQFQK